MDPESGPSSNPVATESTPLLAGPASAPRAPRPVPRWVVNLHWLTAVDGLLVVALAIAIIVIHELFRPPMYDLPWAIHGSAFSVILASLLSTTSATITLVRVRRKRGLMPALFAAIIHGGFAFYLVIAAIEGVRDSIVTKWHRCYSWEPVDPIKEHECLEWAWKFGILLWVYLGAVLVLGLAHMALFVYACVVLYHDVSCGENWARWRVPGGQLSVEFSVKFLRQDMDQNLPGPVPARNESSVPAEQ